MEISSIIFSPKIDLSFDESTTESTESPTTHSQSDTNLVSSVNISLVQQWRKNYPANSIGLSLQRGDLASSSLTSSCKIDRATASLTTCTIPSASRPLSPFHNSLPTSATSREDKECVRSPEIKTIQSPSAESVTNFVADRACQILAEINQSLNDRLEKSSTEPSQLKKGIFYPNDYCELLLDNVDMKAHQQLRKNGSYYCGLAPQEFFEVRRLNLKTFTTVYFGGYWARVLPGRSASDALEAFLNGLTLTSSTEICQLSLFLALRDLLTKDKFDILFDARSPCPLTLYGDFTNNPTIQCLFSVYSITATPDGQIQKGDMVVFRNSPSYGWKHVNGEFSVLATLCDSAPGQPVTFSGFWLPPAMTRDEILDELCEEYNRESHNLPLLPIAYASKLSKASLPPLDTASKERLIKEGMGEYYLIRIRPDRILQLVKSSPEEGLVLLKEWSRQPIERHR